MATLPVLTPVLTPLLTVKQMIADQILHGWQPLKIHRRGVDIFWLANTDRQALKGACHHVSGLPDMQLMKQVMLDVIEGKAIPEECDWKWVPEELIPQLVVANEMVLSV